MSSSSLNNTTLHVVHVGLTFLLITLEIANQHTTRHGMQCTNITCDCSATQSLIWEDPRWRSALRLPHSHAGNHQPSIYGNLKTAMPLAATGGKHQGTWKSTAFKCCRLINSVNKSEDKFKKLKFNVYILNIFKIHSSIYFCLILRLYLHRIYSIHFEQKNICWSYLKLSCWINAKYIGT